MGLDTRHEVDAQYHYWARLESSHLYPHHSLDAYENGQPSKTRKYHVVSRMGPNHSLGVYNNTVSAVERALVERYFLCKVGDQFLPALGSSRRVWECDELVGFRRKVVDRVKEQATVITLREVVECYRGPKHRIYLNAYRSLMRSGFNKKDAALRPFTKFEKQALNKAPRIINPRSPRYNLVLGKYLKKAEKSYFNAINLAWGGHTTHTVVKGLNVFEAAAVMKAKWDRFREPVAIGLDATKFDMHVTVSALMYEHAFYNDVFKSEELAEILAYQLHQQGKAYCPDGVVEFKVPGTRASGDLNTSLGNCILMCALIKAFVDTLGIDAELANNGDDCVLFVEKEHEQAVLCEVKRYFHTYGFRMTVEEPVYELGQVEFCQSRPVLLPAGWAMVRNLRTCLQKDPMCLLPLANDKAWRKWLGAVGECGLASVPGCPVLQSFYAAFKRSGTTSSLRFKRYVFNNTGTMERCEGLSARSVPVTDEARASFYMSTGVPPDYQIALEAYYDQLSIGPMNEMLDVRQGEVEVTPPAYIRHL